MIVWAIIRVTRSKNEWTDLYATPEHAQEVCDAMNARLHKRTTPYAVYAVTVYGAERKSS